MHRNVPTVEEKDVLRGIGVHRHIIGIGYSVIAVLNLLLSSTWLVFGAVALWGEWYGADWKGMPESAGAICLIAMGCIVAPVGVLQLRAGMCLFRLREGSRRKCIAAAKWSCIAFWVIFLYPFSVLLGVYSLIILRRARLPSSIPEGDVTGIEIKVAFFPLAFLFFFCEPRIEIDGEAYERPWGKHFLAISPGEHRITVYFWYFFMSRCGENSISLSVAPGGIRRLHYYMPPWMFAKGSLKAS